MATIEEKKQRQIFGMSRNVFMKKYGIMFILLIMVGLLCIFSPSFRTTANVLSILQTVSTNGILALGMVFVITAGGIDLSIGPMLALTSVIIGQMFHAGYGIVPACILSVVVCGLFGLVNGVLVSRFKMFPFVVTLATQLVIRGTAYIISNGKTLSITSKGFRFVASGRVGGVIPMAVIILAIVAVAAYIMLHWTKFGRYVYAVGGNINAAFAAGVRVQRIQTLTYVWMGVCAAVSGIIITSRVNASQPNIGTGYETDAIAACVIGGTSFAGGISTIPGTIIGILIIGVIYNGMNLLRLSSYLQIITKGLLILIAVMLDMYLNKRRS